MGRARLGRRGRLCGFPAAVILVASLVGACERAADSDDSYAARPQLRDSVHLTAAGDTLQPLRLQVHRDSLWVSYRGVPRLDVYDLSLTRLASVPLTDPEPVQPSAFAVTDSAIYVCDHSNGMIVAYDRSGTYLDSFGTLPDGETRLSPLALTHFGGVLYVADIALRQILAVSVADAPGITETGELILTIPGDLDQELGFPSAVHVTADGRLLVGDAESGTIRVFTCDGREMYGFETVPDQTALSPQGIASDGRVDPSLQDDSSFDPSGLRAEGRFHVIDSHAGRVHMFNPLGRYVASYPEPGKLERPASIAIDRTEGRIFVADPPSRLIHVFATRQG